jgi:hypothetical protein
MLTTRPPKPLNFTLLYFIPRASHYTVSLYHGPNDVLGNIISLGLNISAVSLSAREDRKDTVFRQVTIQPFPVLSNLSPHSEPQKLFK